MGELDYYKILGLPRGATTSQVRLRYQALAKKYHPDRSGDDSIMAIINEAYSTLSDPRRRFQYNQSLDRPMATASPSQPVSNPGVSSVFDSIDLDFMEDSIPESKDTRFVGLSDLTPKKRVSVRKMVFGTVGVFIALFVAAAALSPSPTTKQLNATNTASSSSVVNSVSNNVGTQSTPNSLPAIGSGTPGTQDSDATPNYSSSSTYAAPLNANCTSNNIGSTTSTNCSTDQGSVNCSGTNFGTLGSSSCYGSDGSYTNCSSSNFGTTGSTNCYGSGGATNCSTTSIGSFGSTNCYGPNGSTNCSSDTIGTEKYTNCY